MSKKIIAIFDTVGLPHQVLNRFLQDNISEAAGHHFWLANPEYPPSRDNAEIEGLGGKIAGTIPPVPSDWTSPFVGKTAQECNDWLNAVTDWSASAGETYMEVCEGTFIKLDATLQRDGLAIACKEWSREEVENSRELLVQEWLELKYDPEYDEAEGLDYDEARRRGPAIPPSDEEIGLEIREGVEEREVSIRHGAVWTLYATSGEWSDGTQPDRAELEWYGEALGEEEQQRP